jgi:hypothetical protein
MTAIIIYRDDQGDYCGYDVEYFYEISKHTDWQYQYIDFGSFEDAYAALETGEIDLLPSLFYTEERADTLLLSELRHGSRVRDDHRVTRRMNTSIAYNDYCRPGRQESRHPCGFCRRGEIPRMGRKNRGCIRRSSPCLHNGRTAESAGRGRAWMRSPSPTWAPAAPTGSSKEFSPMKMYVGMPRDHAAADEGAE